VRLGVLLVVALAARLAFIHLRADFIGGDEAVGALIALKIAAGEEFPLVYWGAHYGGTFMYYLDAAAFRLLGPSVAALRLGALPLGLVGIAALASAARALWGAGPALVGGLWLAAGPPVFFALSAQAWPSYPEVLAFGGLTLWLGVRLGLDPKTGGGSRWQWVALGAAAGFGTYGLLFVLPIFAGTLWALRRIRGRLTTRDCAHVAAGFALGVSPLIVYNVMVPGATVTRLAARVFDVSRSEVTGSSSSLALLVAKAAGYVERLALYPAALLGNVPSALGLPVWGVWLAAAVGLVVAVSSRTRRRSPGAAASWRSRGGFGGALLGRCALAVLVFGWISDLDAVRHLFPFYLLVPLGLAALTAGAARWARALVAVGLVLVIANNVAGVVRERHAWESDVATLVGALEARGVRFVYTDYEIAYPVVFLSRERIIASPAAGPTNVDRYAPYTRAVAASPRPAYVFLGETEAGAVFAREMRRAGRPFARETIRGFELYLPESHVDPAELALLRKY
jgi:hypothetical protein